MMPDANNKIPTRALGQTGITVPILGIGCSPFGNRRRAMPDSEAAEAVYRALELGISYFDVAPYYGFGLAERRLGDALRSVQSDAVISTKVGRRLLADRTIDTSTVRNGFHSSLPFRPEFDYSYDGIMRSFEDSLVRMGRAYIDILLVHDIGAFAHADRHLERLREFLEGGYRALDELKQSGAIGAIGLGVNETRVCDEVLDEVQLDCILLAGNYTLLEQENAESLLSHCRTNGTSVILGGPYNSGLLARGGRTDGTALFNFGAAPEGILRTVAAMEQICRSFDVPLAAAALQFPLGHPAICSVLPGVGSAERVTETLQLLNWQIPDAFWSSLKDEGLLASHVAVPVSPPPLP